MRPYMPQKLQIDGVFSLSRCDPLQQISAREYHSAKRAQDGIGHKPRLVGHKRERSNQSAINPAIDRKEDRE